MSGQKSLIGNKFPSFLHVKRWIAELGGTDYNFSIANSKTIVRSKVKGPFANGLKYYEIYYRCSRAESAQMKAGGTGERKNRKTGCLARITLRAKDKKSLEVTDCQMEHCHNKNVNPESTAGASTSLPALDSNRDSILPEVVAEYNIEDLPIVWALTEEDA